MAIWTELARMAGGADALAEHAAAHIAADEPLHALHLIEIALSDDPRHEGSLRAQATVLEMLIEQTQGHTFDDLAYLEDALSQTRAKLNGER